MDTLDRSGFVVRSQPSGCQKKPTPPFHPRATKPQTILAALPRLSQSPDIVINLLFLGLGLVATTLIITILQSSILRTLPVGSGKWHAVNLLLVLDVACLAHAMHAVYRGLQIEHKRRTCAALTYSECNDLNLPEIPAGLPPLQAPTLDRSNQTTYDSVAGADLREEAKRVQETVYARPRVVRVRRFYHMALPEGNGIALVHGALGPLVITTLFRLPLIYALASPYNLPNKGSLSLEVLTTLTTDVVILAIRLIPLVSMVFTRVILNSPTKVLFNVHLDNILSTYFVDLIDGVSMIEYFQRKDVYKALADKHGEGVISSPFMLYAVLIVAVTQLFVALRALAYTSAVRHGHWVFPDILSQHLTGNYLRERTGRKLLIVLNSMVLALRIALWTQFKVVSTILAIKNIFVIGLNVMRLRNVRELRDSYRQGCQTEKRVCAMAEEFLDVVKFRLPIKPVDWKKPYECDWIGKYSAPAGSPLHGCRIYFRIHFPPRYPSQRPQLFLISRLPFEMRSADEYGQLLYRSRRPRCVPQPPLQETRVLVEPLTPPPPPGTSSSSGTTPTSSMSTMSFHDVGARIRRGSGYPSSALPASTRRVTYEICIDRTGALPHLRVRRRRGSAAPGGANTGNSTNGINNGGSGSGGGGYDSDTSSIVTSSSDSESGSNKGASMPGMAKAAAPVDNHSEEAHSLDEAGELDDPADLDSKQMRALGLHRRHTLHLPKLTVAMNFSVCERPRTVLGLYRDLEARIDAHMYYEAMLLRTQEEEARRGGGLPPPPELGGAGGPVPLERFESISSMHASDHGSGPRRGAGGPSARDERPHLWQWLPHKTRSAYAAARAYWRYRGVPAMTTSNGAYPWVQALDQQRKHEEATFEVAWARHLARLAQYRESRQELKGRRKRADVVRNSRLSMFIKPPNRTAHTQG